MGPQLRYITTIGGRTVGTTASTFDTHTHPRTRSRDHEALLRAGSDGKVLYGRIVTYKNPVLRRGLDGVVRWERFAFGALADAAQHWGSVALMHSHREDLDNVVGWGSSIVELRDGAYATFRLVDDTRDEARFAFDRQGLSLGYESLRNHVDDDGTLVHTRVKVHHVAGVVHPAHEAAEVLDVAASPAKVAEELRMRARQELDEDMALYRAQHPELDENFERHDNAWLAHAYVGLAVR